LTQSMERKIGEDMIIERINKIFDEMAQDRDEFDKSFAEKSMKKPAKNQVHFDQSA